jgi:hypothetical protein
MPQLPVIWETLYNTNVPEELEHAEFYQPRIEKVCTQTGALLYFVTEIHGWWEPGTKHAPNVQKTLDPRPNPEHGFFRFDDAKLEYEKQLRHRASEGFIHSFAPRIDIDHGVVANIYRLIQYP